MHTRICVIFLSIFMLSALSLDARAKEDSGKTGRFSFAGDVISEFLLKTFFLPAELLATEPQAEPVMTEAQSALYDIDDLPIDLERDIVLLIDRETGRVKQFWSEKDEEWIEPDGEVREYLQGRYEDRDALREEADRHRRIKSLQNRLREMSNSRWDVKRNTGSVR